ncbi:efflux transporter outer membrane subunit, partial [Thioclava sp. BHET1]
LAALMAKTRPIPVPRLPVPRGVPADILTARPDVRAAERSLAQSTALIGVAEAQRYPSISLTGSISTTGGQIGDLAKSSSIGWSFGPGISIPLFHSGALKAAVDVAKAERDQAFLTYRATVLTALEDVENASVALTQDQRKYARLQEAAGAYRQALTLSQSLYKSGSLSFLDLLDSERSLYSAESALIQSRAAITTDYVSLMKALGGGWNGLAGNAGTQNGSASQ